jgi:hypothetical protein
LTPDIYDALGMLFSTLAAEQGEKKLAAMADEISDLQKGE